MKPGIYRMPNEGYHAMRTASKSFLHTLLTKSPAHAMAPKKETPALYDGQAIHCAVFEPLRYETEYIAKPEGLSFATREGKAWREFNRNLKIVEFEKDKNFRAMAAAVRAHLADHEDPTVKDLLTHGEPELSAFWKDPHLPDILCSARFDWLNQRDHIIVDLKSCMDAGEHKFTNDAYTRGYDMQSFYYPYGLTQITRFEHNQFFFIACEKEPPYGVQVYKATEEFMHYGGVRCSKALAIYKQCMDSGNWPCYLPEVKGLNLPGWVMRKEGYSQELS